MFVYIVWEFFSTIDDNCGDGQSVLGVFSTEEKAREFKQRICAMQPEFEEKFRSLEYPIEVVEIDCPQGVPYPKKWL